MTSRKRRCISHTLPADEPAGSLACGKLQTTSCTLACGMGWAAVAVQHSIKVCYYFTMAASKAAVNWIQLCYYLRMATCAFFTNLVRWKFPYENRLVEILRESYDILAYERCHTCFDHVLLHGQNK